MNDKDLTSTDLDAKSLRNIKTEDYISKNKIAGVEIVNLNQFSTEDGYFLELSRITNGKLKSVANFKMAQISYSLVEPKAIKAWHIHYKQNDLWFVPPHDRLLVGLIDTRKDSPTVGTVVRLTLGCHKSSLLKIPKGIAHGCANNSSKPVSLIYITDSEFNLKNPDEHRLPWDYLGSNFWEMQKG